MIGGVEVLPKITKCFRDEDLRADRQPEFYTGVDMENGILSAEDVWLSLVFWAMHLQKDGREFPAPAQIRYWDCNG